ncbi:hypothetical protein GCM10027176_45820 [Actinoallomurus bryophytorum]|uniref:Uncharacterized protein n=1 Tax=Actinoallomurus bryophytorum TaxID=1490222 RepID=A0A543CCF2_9ACTN|nr:hypothetical protein [Actinoallomurus bryophytorum]TQL94766.1 hypothetical protein FB559_0248 [Actinoallomurus bryophytorum]
MTAQASAKAVTGTGAVQAGPCTLRGLSLRDTSGSGNTVKIYDNASAASGTVLYAYALGTSGATTPPVTIDGGLRAVNGLYLSTTGSVEGSVWIA